MKQYTHSNSKSWVEHVRYWSAKLPDEVAETMIGHRPIFYEIQAHLPPTITDAELEISKITTREELINNGKQFVHFISSEDLQTHMCNEIPPPIASIFQMRSAIGIPPSPEELSAATVSNMHVTFRVHYAAYN